MNSELAKAIDIIRQNQWSHCGSECVICGASPYMGHHDNCPITKLWESLGLDKDELRVRHDDSTVRERTGPPIDIKEIDRILKDLYTRRT